ncbi:hypothetical protein EDD85DRAFT_832172, partial [Armillaria nabsnona]
MPSAMMCLGSQTLCYKCDKKMEAPQRCGKCKTARYCSRECQKQHWPEHKPHCINHGKEMDPDYQQEVFKPYTHWLDKWRHTVEVWSFFASDFSSHLLNSGGPPCLDFFLKNIFVLSITPTIGPQKKASSRKGFKYVDSEFMTREDVITRVISKLPFEHDYQQAVLHHLDSQPIKNHIIRIIIASDRIAVSMYQPIGSLKTNLPSIDPPIYFKDHANPFSSKGCMMAAKLSRDYKDHLRKDIDEGNVDGYLEYFRSKLQELSE